MSRPLVYASADILRVAARVFLEDGHKASTKRIADIAGVSEAMLFQRFKTKEALFEAAMSVELGVDDWGQNLISQVGHHDPETNLTEALSSLLKRLQTIVPKIIMLRAAGKYSGPRRMLKDSPFLRAARVIRDYLLAEQRRGRLQPRRALLHAHQMVGSVAHYVSIAEMSGTAPGRPREYIKLLVESQIVVMRPSLRSRSRIVAVLLLFFCGISGGFAAESITWMQCVKEAAFNNPGIAAARKEVERTDAVRKGAYSTFIPQLGLSAGFSRAKQEQMVNSSTGIIEVTTFGEPGFWSNYTDSYSAQLTLQQTIFDGFATRGKVTKARAETNVAVAKLLTQKAGASFELKSAYAQLLYAQTLLGVLTDIIAQRERNFRMVELKYDNGRENRGAVLMSRALLSQARLEYTQAQRLLEVSRIQLATVMGRNTYADFAVKGELVTETPMKSPDYRALALSTPAIFQQSAITEAAKAGITVAQSDFYPQINATANIGLRSATGFDQQPNTWALGMTGSWAVFDGTQTYFNVRAARVAHETSQATLRQTNDNTARTLAENYNALLDAIDQIAVGAELYAASSLRTQIVEAQYRNGLASFQEFDQITNDKITRQKRDLLNRRDAVLAEARWEQSLGVGAIP